MANAKKYEDLTFTDDFMFCKVMTTNPELCHELLELILGKKVGAFTRLDQQKPIEMTADGKGLHKYTFENRCKEMPELVLGDESTKIFLCAGGNADDVSDDMKDFLNWLTTEQIGDSELVKKLQNAVENAQNQEEWRLEYMTLLMRDNEMREEGREEGRKEGRKEGRNAERTESIRNMIKCGVAKEKILELYTEEEFEKATKDAGNDGL